MKKLWRCLLGVMLVIAATSAIQYLQVARNENYRNLLVMAKKTHQRQMPVDLTLRIVDQFGAPAIHYRIKVGLHYAHWYYWLFPFWGAGEKCYLEDTDEQGIARLHPWCQSASYINFRQVDLFQYDFPIGKQCSDCQSFEENPWGLFSLPKEVGKKQEMVLHVLKHDPPAKLKRLAIQYADRPDSLYVGIKNENIFTLSFAEGRFFEGAREGDVIIRIRNAKEAYEAYVSKNGALVREPSKRYPPWLIAVEGRSGWGLAFAPEDYLTYAPESGYQERLASQVLNRWALKDDGTWLQIFMSRQGAPYYLLNLSASLESHSLLRVAVNVAYNPDGSRNFYKQTRPNDEIRRNKKLCQ